MYHAIRALTACAAMPPVATSLQTARWLGRRAALLRSNRTRLQRAIDNLAVAFPEWTPERRQQAAVRSYEHLFMLGVEMMYAPRQLTLEGWCSRVQLLHLAPLLRGVCADRPSIFISGHCGNWELSGYSLGMLGFRIHALYRPLDIQPLDAYVRRTRERSGLVLVDKFGATRRLPAIMAEHHPVGFVADQNAGDRGLFVPFFNRLASSYKAIGLLAMQHQATVVVGLARRLGGERIEGTDLEREPRALQYRIDGVDAFGPEEYMAQPDPLFYITARYRRAIEQSVRLAPEQYLWMHRYWKSRPRHERLGKPFPRALLEKIRQLPWITEADVEAIVEHSRRDAAEWAKAHPPAAAPVEEEPDDGDDEGM